MLSKEEIVERLEYLKKQLALMTEDYNRRTTVIVELQGRIKETEFMLNYVGEKALSESGGTDGD